MPKKLERKLKAQAKKEGLTGKRADAYVYGTLRKTGWTPKRKASHNPSDNIMCDVKLGKFIDDRRNL